MATQTEGTLAADHLVVEIDRLSRDTVTVVSGQNLVAGAVVGKITASGKYKEYDNAAVDGSETAAGVLVDAVDASAADTLGVITARLSEVRLAALTWKSGMSQGDKDAGVVDLAALFVIAR